jgi:hypothetical protein
MKIEDIKTLLDCQGRDLIYRVLMSKMPIAYTSDNIGEMEKDLKIRSDYEDNRIKKVKY